MFVEISYKMGYYYLFEDGEKLNDIPYIFRNVAILDAVKIYLDRIGRDNSSVELFNGSLFSRADNLLKFDKLFKTNGFTSDTILVTHVTDTRKGVLFRISD